MFKEGVFGDEQRTPPRPLPLHDPRSHWEKAPDSGLRATWLGHSTVLLEIDGARVLTDPVWGPRASPSTLVGPLRFHPPPVEFEALPKLDAVLISHDHYDHLDMVTIRALAGRGVPFYVPLGVGAHLEAWGVPPERITELEWWQEAQVPGTGLTLISTPSQHFSGRALHDRNRTLWTSWVVRSPQHRAYFSGDTGLAPEFPEIGRRLGPFDLVMLEVGAWNPAWGAIHLGAEQALTALGQLGGGPLLPIHWGTFNLAFHAWDDPLETLSRRAPELGVTLLTPRIGEPLEPSLPPRANPWWREVTNGTAAPAGIPTSAVPGP
jgi:L-ascorbate metabolism protein UlaG (beta-lactamase superfamily)